MKQSFIIFKNSPFPIEATLINYNKKPLKIIEVEVEEFYDYKFDFVLKNGIRCSVPEEIIDWLYEEKVDLILQGTETIKENVKNLIKEN